MYYGISKQVIVRKGDKQQISFLRDFNAKNRTQGNKNTVPKRERQLTSRKHGMVKLNVKKSNVKAYGPKSAEEKRSVIDYIFTNKESLDTVKSNTIDWKMDFRTCRTENQWREKRRTHSEHNTILVNIDIASILKSKVKGKTIQEVATKRTEEQYMRKI